MKVLPLLFVSLIGLAACSPKPAGEVVAQIGSRGVSASELGPLFDGLDAGARERLGTDSALMEQTVRQYLEQLAVVDEARRKGWDQRPEVKAAIAAAERELLVRSYLAEVSQPPAEYPSTAEMQAAYDTNTGSFVVPKRYRLAQIFIAAGQGADASVVAAAREQANTLAQRARAKDADFAALARSYSQNAASAANGGDSGLVPEAQLLPEVRQVLPGLGLNEIAGPLRSPAGFHIVKLLETRAAEVEPFEDAKPQLRALLRQRRQEALARDWLAEFRKRQPITVNGIALKAALPTPAPAKQP